MRGSSSNAGAGRKSYAKYGRVALPQIVKRGCKILYNGTPLRDDPTTGHWDRVVIVYYPSRATFLDMWLSTVRSVDSAVEWPFSAVI